MAGRKANSFYMLAGQIIGKAGLFVSLMIYSRTFSDAEFGELLFAVAVSLILFFLADMGASLVTTRRLVSSGDPSGFLSSALFLRTLLTGFSLIVLTAFNGIMGYTETQVKLLYLVFAGFVLDGYFETFYALFRARDRMVFEGVTRALQGGLAVALALVIRRLGLGYLWAGASYPLRSILPFLLCFSAAMKITGAGFLKPKGMSQPLDLLKKSLPLGLMGFVLVAGQRFDNVMVKAFLSDSAVAAWQQCYRLFEPMVLLVAPTLLPGALFADLCRAEQSGWPRVRERIRWMTEAFTVMAFLIVIPFYFYGMEVLELVWGQGYLRNMGFMEIRSSLRMLMMCLPVTYIFHIYLAVILAQGRQRVVLPAVTLSFLLQVAGLFLFLEHRGLAAAASMQLVFISVLTLWLGINARKNYGATGFLRGIARPLAGLLPFAASALFLSSSPAVGTVVSLSGLILIWLLAGGAKIVTSPPLSLKNDGPVSVSGG